MKTHNKFQYQTQPDGVKIAFRNGKPVMAIQKAPKGLEEQYPNVIALGRMQEVNLLDILAGII
jgi:hypothetical protein